jgi:hypothetical protein
MSTENEFGYTEIIDVLCIFDAEGIIDRYPSPSKDPANPTPCDHAYIFMVTEKNNIISGNGGAELRFSAKVDDIARWRASTLSKNTGYYTQLYNFVASAGGDLLTPPNLLTTDVKIPVPNPADPPHPTELQNITGNYWQATIIKVGSVGYHWSFMILDRNGNLIGYFRWDPSITITN